MIDISRLVPITYMNSSAALKAFVGRHGGAVCTSTNARAVLEWAFRPAAEGGAGGTKVLFFPDQHLGRNTGLAMGYTHDDMRVWNPHLELGGLTEADCKEATFLLWRGHCSVHQRFRPEHVDAFRETYPDGIVVAHPESQLRGLREGRSGRLHRLHHPRGRGSTRGIGHRRRDRDPPRAATRRRDPGKTIVSLDPLVCPCSTMFRIDAPHLCWVLENLVEGRVVNQITVDAETADAAKVALERMLAIT